MITENSSRNSSAQWSAAARCKAKKTPSMIGFGVSFHGTSNPFFIISCSSSPIRARSSLAEVLLDWEEVGAGTRNRTELNSLEGCRITTMLYPLRVATPIAWIVQVVEGTGFEPVYAKRADLQSAGFNHSPTPPGALTHRHLTSRFPTAIRGL